MMALSRAATAAASICAAVGFVRAISLPLPRVHGRASAPEWSRFEGVRVVGGGVGVSTPSSRGAELARAYAIVASLALNWIVRNKPKGY